MDNSWYWRLLLVLGLVGLAGYYFAPSAIYLNLSPKERADRDAIKKAIGENLPDSRFTLGIDLQGGVHLVMGVDTEKAIQDRADRIAGEIVDSMKEKSKKLKDARRKGDAPIITIEMQSEADWPTLKEILDFRDQTWQVRNRSGTTVQYAMRTDYETKIRDDAVAQAQKTLRNRIDQYGVTEPEVRRRGNSSILIQIAGLTAKDYEEAKDKIIGKTAQLEFKIVDDTSKFFTEIAAKPGKPASVTLQQETYRGKDEALITRPYLEGTDKDEIKKFLKDNPPPSDKTVGIQEFRPERKNDKKVLYRTWLLERRTRLTGDSLVDAFAGFNSDENQYEVNMKFDSKGAILFEKLTRENTKRKMAIVLDDIVDSAPMIQGPIPNGSARITLGGFKSAQEILEDANNLSIVLKAGALPAPVYPQEERTVGATLGDDAVKKGQMALTVALGLIIAMMVIYYKGTGIAGVVALMVNLLFLFATLSGFNATLTLPGIAGLALTVGMAVDANIIQFERIREELRLGKTARAAVDAGFDKAFSAIFDANVTTLLAAIVLFQYGSGPIRGFATTLGIGVFINTFTAVVVPRLILEFFTRGRRIQNLSI